jgi:hypothetical protein
MGTASWTCSPTRAFVKRLVTRGQYETRLGVPPSQNQASFGRFGGALLGGNFSVIGESHAYNLNNGARLGALRVHL